MDIKYVFFLLPLSWAIMIYILTDTFTSNFVVGLVVSFVVAGTVTAGLSGFHVLDTGLNDAATWILFVLIFGASFYGVTVAGVSFGATNQHLINGNILCYDTYSAFSGDGWDINNLPAYIKEVSIGASVSSAELGYGYRFANPKYDSTIPVNDTALGFGVIGNTGLGNNMFTDMPYFHYVNLIFGVMYAFGLYMNIAAKKE